MTQEIQRFVPRDHIQSGPALVAAQKVYVEELIHKGRTNADRVIARIRSEIPTDTMARVEEIPGFAEHQGRVIMGLRNGGLQMHRHAIGQLAEDVGVPGGFFTKFLDAKDGDGSSWGAEMCADVLSRTFKHLDAKKRFLIRSVGKEARGVLTDKYRRLSSEMLLEAFLGNLKELDVHPVEGHATDVRWSIRAILGKPVEVANGEVYAYGINIGHSDYGQGALDMSAYTVRLRCTNGAVCDSVFRQVHLGRKIPDDMTFSDKTYRLDSETTASAVNDMVKQLFAPKTVEEKFAKLAAAYEEKLDPKKAEERAVKALGSKEMAKKIVEAFTSGDIEMMPAGQTRARWGQAASWVANAIEDVDQKVALQKYAAAEMGI